VLAPQGIGVQVPSSAPKILPSWAFWVDFQSKNARDEAPESSDSMHFLLYFVIVVHVVVCFFLIGVVLLQQGKSADLAGTFGGQGSQTAFGPRAAANLLTKLTGWAAALFMVTSFALTVLYIRSSGSSTSVFSGMKSTAPVSAPAKPGK
jgi:preprotein translocase subunit SecG